MTFLVGGYTTAPREYVGRGGTGIIRSGTQAFSNRDRLALIKKEWAIPTDLWSESQYL